MSAHDEGTFQHRIQRIEVLVREIEALADPVAQAGAVELVQAVLELHGAGLGRLLETIQQTGPAGAAIVEQISRDDLVASLLLLHDLHPLAPEARVRRAIEALRPHLAVQGSRIDLAGVTDDGVVSLRAEAGDRGLSPAALERLVQDAIRDAAPEVTEILFEHVGTAPAGSFIPLSAVLGKPLTPNRQEEPSPPDPLFLCAGERGQANSPPPCVGRGWGRGQSAMPDVPWPSWGRGQSRMPDAPRPGWLAALRPLARPRPAAERCELCGSAVADRHQHLIEPPTRRLLCCCNACAILFGGGQDTRYRTVPRDVWYLPDMRLTDAQWDGMVIPINVAFFFWSSVARRVVALYPSPAGATESLLPLETWRELVAENPGLGELQEDVEALLVNRLGEHRLYYRAPIDECFRLVGLIRTHWRGLSGGREVWLEIDRFFAELRGRARTVSPSVSSSWSGSSEQGDGPPDAVTAAPAERAHA